MPLTVRLLAPVTDHLSVALAPLVIQEGLALKFWMTGSWSGVQAHGGGPDEPPPQEATAMATEAMPTPRASAPCHLPMSMSPGPILTPLTHRLEETGVICGT